MSNRVSVDLRYVNKTHLGQALLPQAALRLYGPTISVKIGVHPAMAKRLKADGRTVPDPIAGDAMIDTGAAVTAVALSVSQHLQLPNTDKTTVFGIGGQSEGYTNPISILFPGLNNIVMTSPRAHCHDFSISARHIIALIGRDILDKMTFFYDGLNGECKLVHFLPLGMVRKKGSTAAQQRPKERKKRR
jgi:hypothetical protein